MTHITDPTEDQMAQLRALEGRPIDTNDIPEAAGLAHGGSQPANRPRPPKEAISIRLDSDVLAWLRGQGPGYQRRINAMLRREMHGTPPRSEFAIR